MLKSISFTVGFLVLNIVYCMASESGSNQQTREQESSSTMASSFKYKYVTRDRIYDVQPRSESLYIEVSATLDVTELAHQKAALIISRVLRYTPSHIFGSVCLNVRVGVFTNREDPTVFSEFSGTRDTPECKGTCEGRQCAQTCTEDGRKYSELAGLGGRRTAILEDNILCNEADPYGGAKNILVHEFAHSIYRYGLEFIERLKIKSAYENAFVQGLWSMDSYAMRDELEYFAESSAVFFNAEAFSSGTVHEPTGGMTSCDGQACVSEKALRSHLQQNDVELFKMLSYVYTDGNPWIPGHIGPCV